MQEAKDVGSTNNELYLEGIQIASRRSARELTSTSAFRSTLPFSLSGNCCHLCYNYLVLCSFTFHNSPIFNFTPLTATPYYRRHKQIGPSGRICSCIRQLFPCVDSDLMLLQYTFLILLYLLCCLSCACFIVVLNH